MPEQDIFSDDYTRMVNYQSRSWMFGDDVSLAGMGGIQWTAAAAAAAVSAAVTVLAVLALWVGTVSVWWALLVPPAPLLWVYARLAKEVSGGLTELQRLRLQLHHRWQQPEHFNGLTADTEPTEFCWDAMFWRAGRLRSDANT